MKVVEQIAAAVIVGDEKAAPALVAAALRDELPARRVLEDGLLAGMSEVGRRFRDAEYFLPEVLIAAEAMQAGLAVLRPHLLQEGVRARATAVIGTVRGDLHDIGKNLVAIMLAGAGFEVIDLGVDVPGEKFIAACRDRAVQLVAMSALLTTTMPQMEIMVKQLRDALRPAPRIIVGGAPLTQAYADRIGADGYGRDAATGAEVAKKLCFDTTS